MDIIFIDSYLLVVNKSAGIATNPGGWKQQISIREAIEGEFGQTWIVHRLDKSTTGLLVFARNADVHRNLSQQFESHQVEKSYHAILVGVPKWNNLHVNFPLRADVGHQHRTIVDTKQGKSSETEFHVLEQLKGFTLMLANPASGRTHQIRAHATATGFPLLGDMLYGAPPTMLINRPALHAYSLSFEHPYLKERVSFVAPYPEDFTNALEALVIK